MNRSMIPLLFALLMAIAHPARSMDPSGIVRLRDAGVGAETIRMLEREKSIETCSFTVQEILDLKKAGLSEETIRLLIQERSFLKNARTVEYGRAVRPVSRATVQDLIDLKGAGMGDEIIRDIIRYGIWTPAGRQREEALEYLDQTPVIVDLREEGQVGK